MLRDNSMVRSDSKDSWDFINLESPMEILVARRFSSNVTSFAFELERNEKNRDQ